VAKIGRTRQFRHLRDMSLHLGAHRLCFVSEKLVSAWLGCVIANKLVICMAEMGCELNKAVIQHGWNVLWSKSKKSSRITIEFTRKKIRNILYCIFARQIQIKNVKVTELT
jgi:hypothetical protein